jgi:hypothetical protein
VIAGNTYNFKSEIASDFITIANNNGAVAFASGTGGLNGLEWEATITEIVRFYTHTNSSCGNSASCREKWVCCVAPSCNIALTSSTSTDDQNVCVNLPITDIAYTSIGATGATFSGLPNGVSGNWSGDIATISGTPTQTGIFNYSVTATGCTGVVASGTITVNSGYSSPYLEDFESGASTWINTGWTLDAGGTLSTNTGPQGTNPSNGAAINTDAPDGSGVVGGSYLYFETSNPVQVGDQISYESGCCLDLSGLSNPCITFDYHMYAGGGFESEMGTLDVFINGNNIWNISGNQGDQWIANEVSLSDYAGLCVVVEFVATKGSGYRSDIAIDNISIENCATACTINLTSSSSTDAQNICVNSLVTDITYTTTGATGATFSGLPNGVSGNWSEDIATISGAPTQTGIFNYSVSVTGCTGIVASGTITANSNMAPYLEDFESGNSGVLINEGWFVDTYTLSTNTGPQGTNNFNPPDGSGLIGGNFIYFESSVPPSFSGQQLSLLLECIDLSSLSNPCLTFNHYMYGNTMGSLDLLINDSSVWSLSDDQGEQWISVEIPLTSYLGDIIDIEFAASRGSGPRSDIAIDNISINDCPIYGCTDPTACNYNPTANSDDGTCVFIIVDANSDQTICEGSIPSNLSASSGGVTGSYIWSPSNDFINPNVQNPDFSNALNSTTEYTVTFSDSITGCVSTDSIIITVTPNITPIFLEVGPYCSEIAIPELPNSSLNGISGTWLPSINNVLTTEYTFTPSIGICADESSLTITINPLPSPGLILHY